MDERQYQLVRVIQKLRLFKGLEAEAIKDLLQICRLKNYATAQKIYQAGDPSREMLILLTGKLNVISDAGEKLAEISSGSSVGEMGVFTGQVRSADIVAAEASTGIAISKIDLQKLLEKNRDMYLNILQNLVHVLSERLVDANRLNDTHIQTIMKMEDQLVRHTGMTSRELEKTENQ